MESSYNHKKIIVVVAAAAMFGVGPALATTTTPVFCNPSEAIDVSKGSVVAKNQNYKMEGATQTVSGTVVKYAEADSAICLLDDSHNEFTLTGSTAEFGVVVAVNDVTVNLDNASIASNKGAGISFEDGFNATLKFKGTTNGITGFDGFAGIAKTSKDGKLIIDGSSKENSLSVNGGAGAAGIGGNSGQTVVKGISILAGTITAKGGQYGAAIGGGEDGSASNITIGVENDPFVFTAHDNLALTALGNDGGAGIGGGAGGGADSLVFNDGYIYAEALGNSSATAAIGAGANASCRDIIFNNGVVKAKGGAQSSGIGADDQKRTSCEGIVINNGSINAYAGADARDAKAIGKKEPVTITGGSIIAVSITETYDDIVNPMDAQHNPVHRFNIKATEKADDSLFVRSTTKGKFSAEAAVAQGEVFENGGDWDNGKFFPTHHLDVDMNAGATINQQDQIWAFFGENEEHDLMVNPSVTEEFSKTVASSGKTSRIKWDAAQSMFIYNIALLNSFPHDFLVYNGYEQGVKVDSSKIWIMGPDSSAFVTLTNNYTNSKTNNYFDLSGDSLTNANVKCQEEFVSRSVSVTGTTGAPVALYCDPAGFLTENAPENVYTMTAKDDIFYGAAKHEKFMLPYVLDNMEIANSIEPQTNDAKDPIVLAGGFDHLVYNGKEQVQDVASITLFNNEHYSGEFQDYVLDATEDYEITGNKVTNASENYEMTISAKSTNFVGSAKRSFVVNQYDITDVDVKSEFENDLTYDPDPLSGNQIQKVKSASLEIGDTTVELTYSSSSKSVKDAGNYTIDLHGSGNFTGFHSAEFTVAPFDISKAGYQVAVTSDAYVSEDGDPTKLHVDYPVYNDGETITQKFAVWTGAKTLNEITGEKVNYTYTGNVATEVGVYDIVVTGQGNYTGTISTTWTILDKEAVLVTIVLKNDTVVYDAKEHVWGGKDIIKSATYVLAGNQTENPLPFELDNIVISEDVSIKCTNVNDECSYTVKADDIKVKNYGKSSVTVPSPTFKLVITQAPVTVAVAGKNDSVIFDNQEHKLSGYDITIPAEWAEILKAEDVTCTVCDTIVRTRTSVGVDSLGLTAAMFDIDNSNFNVTFDVTDGKLVIEKASVEVAIAGKSDTATFDNQEHKFAGYDVTIPEAWAEFLRAEDIICTGCDSVVGRNANEYALGLSAEKFASANGNFDASFDVTDGKLVIEKALVPVKIVSNNATKTFNGKQQKAEGFTLEAVNASQAFVSADSVIYKGDSFVAGVNVGEYALKFDSTLFESVSNNYAVKVMELEDGKLSIEPAPISISVVGKTDSVFYDSKEHSLTGYDVKIPEAWAGFLKAEDITCNGCGSAVGTNVGEYPLVLKAENFKSNNDNFTVDFNVANGGLVIDKAPIEVKITGKTETKSYAAKKFKVSGYNAEIAKNVSNAPFNKSDIVMLNGAVAEASGTDAGKYPMGLKATNFAYNDTNYNVTFTIASDGELEIKPAYVIVTIEGARDTVVYDGKVHSVSGYTVTASDSNFGSDGYEFIGKSSNAEASGKNGGVFYMALADTLFKFKDRNFTGIFVVKNGAITIVKPKEDALKATRVVFAKVHAIEGGIVVDNAYGKAISVFSVNGKAVYNNVRSENTSGSTVISVPRGMYVVKVGSDVQRVTVK